MAESRKCPHPVCNCLVTNDDFGGYCSTHCREAKDMAELRCECGHAACKA